MNKTILKTGLIAGTLDISAASINFIVTTGRNPVLVLKYIASGIFGKELAYSNEFMPIIGLFLHYLIAFSFTIFFFGVYPKIKNYNLNWKILGVLYGLFVWVVMNLIIVPLSNTPKRPFTFQGITIGAGILILCIGLPIAYFAHKYSKTDS